MDAIASQLPYTAKFHYSLSMYGYIIQYELNIYLNPIQFLELHEHQYSQLQIHIIHSTLCIMCYTVSCILSQLYITQLHHVTGKLNYWAIVVVSPIMTQSVMNGYLLPHICHTTHHMRQGGQEMDGVLIEWILMERNQLINIYKLILVLN